MLIRLWLLLFLLVAMGWIDIRKAFDAYRKDNNKGKLLAHAVLIIFLGTIVFDGTYYMASTELDDLNAQTHRVETLVGVARNGHGFKRLPKKILQKRKSIAVKDKSGD